MAIRYTRLVLHKVSKYFEISIGVLNFHFHDDDILKCWIRNIQFKNDVIFQWTLESKRIFESDTTEIKAIVLIALFQAIEFIAFWWTQGLRICRSSHWRCSIKTAVLKMFPIFAGKYSHLFSPEYCEIFKNCKICKRLLLNL